MNSNKVILTDYPRLYSTLAIYNQLVRMVLRPAGKQTLLRYLPVTTKETKETAFY